MAAPSQCRDARTGLLAILAIRWVAAASAGGLGSAGKTVNTAVGTPGPVGSSGRGEPRGLRSHTGWTSNEGPLFGEPTEGLEVSTSQLQDLPSNCSADGVIRLEPSAVYRAWRLPPGPACTELRGAAGARVIMDLPLILPLSMERISGNLEFRGSGNPLQGAALSRRKANTGRHDFKPLTIAPEHGQHILFRDLNNIVPDAHGGAIDTASLLVLSGDGNITFTRCSAAYGGAISAATVLLTGSLSASFDHCSARNAGGAILGKSSVTLNGSGSINFSTCVAGQGGAIAAWNTAKIIPQGPLSFSECQARNGTGGALYATSVMLHAQSPVTFWNCQGAWIGGAICGEASVIVISKAMVSFWHCSAISNGGAIFGGAKVTLVSVGQMIFSDCSTQGVGGAVFGGGGASVDVAGNMAFLNCRARNLGGGIFTGGPNFIKSTGRLVFSDCDARRTGGGIATGARVELSGSGSIAFVGCTAADNMGSALTVLGGPLIVDGNSSLVTVHDCKDTVCSGAIYAQGTSLPCGNVLGELSPSMLTAPGPGLLACTPRDKAREVCPVGTQGAYDGARWKGICQSCPPGRVTWKETDAATVVRFAEKGALTICSPCDRLGEPVGGVVISCPGGAAAAVPSGAMLLNAGNATPEVLRCPNFAACYGQRLLGVAPGGATVGLGDMCSRGYVGAGCAQCGKGFGRSLADPFVCNRCASSGWHWTGSLFFLQPLALTCMGIYFAQYSSVGLAGSILKVSLSWSTVAGLAARVVPHSRQYMDAKNDWMEAAQVYEVGRQVAQGTMAYYSGSLDCLMGHKVRSQDDRLLMTLRFPLLALACMVLRAGCRLCAVTTKGTRTERLHLAGRLLLKDVLVLQNTVYDTLAAACAAYLPCISLKDNEWLQAYAIEKGCPMGYPPTRNASIALAGLACLVATGPALWVYLIRSSRGWDSAERLAQYGFLMKGYRPGREWWEAAVLSRKMAVAFVGALVPLSYAPGRFVIWTLSFLVAAQCAHLLCKPYQSNYLTRLEGLVLTASLLVVLLAGASVEEWFGERAIFFIILILFVAFLLVSTTFCLGLLLAAACGLLGPCTAFRDLLLPRDLPQDQPASKTDMEKQFFAVGPQPTATGAEAEDNPSCDEEETSSADESEP